ncbi:MAG: NADH-quinone oxidoreductase subunit K [Bdellovibrionales bacterium RIFOXYD1_FULL_53_11]|nr:MAG: NADH-quinone oxidoreductase subunit K [Bdellovibrionales bacterium RIFOXYD1_FULL_53_11]
MKIDPWMVQALAAGIFMIGFAGVLVRRNVIAMLMCVELMLNAANMSFVAYAWQHADMAGQAVAVFVMAVAAAGAAVGLAIVVSLFRALRSADTGGITLLKE